MKELNLNATVRRRSDTEAMMTRIRTREIREKTVRVKRTYSDGSLTLA